MHARRLAVIAAVVLAVAFSTLAYGAAAKQPTQEQNMAKFKNAPDTAVVAVVGGQNITKGELMKTLWDWMAPSMLDEYINYKTIMFAAAKRGIKVTPADIQKQMEEAKKSFPPGDTIESMLAKSKVTLARVKAGMAMKTAMDKIMEKDNAPAASDYADYIKARHILVNVAKLAPDAKEADKTKADADAKAKAEKIIAEIKGGKSFEDAAKEYSDDPGSKERGGDLSWFTKGRMVPEFSEAAFKLPVGQISEPVKSPFGYHIIQVTKTGKSATGADKTELKKMIMDSKSQTLMRSTFDKIRDEAKVKNLISPALPEPKPAVPGMGQPGQPGRPGQPSPRMPRPAPRPAPNSNTPPPAPPSGTEAPPPAPTPGK